MFRQDLLKDQIVVITGGATGLGKSMAKRLGELGARIVIGSRNLERLEKSRQELTQQIGSEVKALPVNVRDADSVGAFADQVMNKMGRVDALINNAAGNFLAASEDLSANAFRSVVETVLMGTFFCSQAFGKKMIEQKCGSILNIVATYAFTGSAFVLPSACAKSGVLSLTRSLAVEWGTYGIRVNAIAPGFFPTEGAFSRLMPEGMQAEIIKRIPQGRFGSHGELANLAAFLLAKESEHITGEVITIDGGEWMVSPGFNQLTTLPRENLRKTFTQLKNQRPQ